MNGASERFLHVALSAEQSAHNELLEIWRALDTKAQGVITTAGIFIAAIVAFSSKLSSFDFRQAVEITLTLVGLFLSIGLSALSLYLKNVPELSCSDALLKMNADMLDQSGAEIQIRLENALRDQLAVSQDATQKFKKVMARKAGYLKASYLTLFISIAGVLACYIDYLFTQG